VELLDEEKGEDLEGIKATEKALEVPRKDVNFKCLVVG
tara:strand:- start:1387 stop:1500 length:114 start_codon:yes stop_codon:yes gene_type:complete